jgi:hypothetical protein
MVTCKCFRTNCLRAGVTHPVITIRFAKGSTLPPATVIFDAICDEHRYSFILSEYMTPQTKMEVQDNAKERGLTLDWDSLQVQFRTREWHWYATKNGRMSGHVLRKGAGP